ncbi:hypothetical protein DSO57_1038669 [Entomophthora muscae]|uniref:Uncharacterized protein n=1 Tax=Entomophthora muscae TaxID=34485 RepID=A0ACC2TKC7_9FUNG|nr:hypothetical protein DSO57_1038669 [Entomophthora muscae]
MSSLGERTSFDSASSFFTTYGMSKENAHTSFLKNHVIIHCPICHRLEDFVVHKKKDSSGDSCYICKDCTSFDSALTK